MVSLSNLAFAQVVSLPTMMCSGAMNAAEQHSCHKHAAGAGAEAVAPGRPIARRINSPAAAPNLL
jgi:hypothetical protein